MRRRPCCLRRGGAVVFHSHLTPSKEGVRNAGCPMHPWCLMPMRSSARGMHQAFRNDRAKCPTFRMRCWHGPMGPGRKTTSPDAAARVVSSRELLIGSSKSETSPRQWQVWHGSVPPAGERLQGTARRPSLGVHRIQPRERDDRARPSHRGRTTETIILCGNSSRTK